MDTLFFVLDSFFLIGLAEILHEGTLDTYSTYFGRDFYRYFQNIGYHRLFRIAGRSLREFLFMIDQLHEY